MVYPLELTAQGLAEQRKARMAAILEAELPSEDEERHAGLDKYVAAARLREIGAEFARP